MEEFGKRTYTGEEIARKRKMLQPIKKARDEIVENLPAEQKAVLEKYQTDYDELMELCNKQAYIIGYAHGCKARER